MGGNEKRRLKMKEIFVGNLLYGMDEKELWRLFKGFGRIVSVRIIREGRASKGYGFVNYRDEKDARRAIEGMDNVYYERRVLTVAEAIPYKGKNEKSPPEEGEAESEKPRNLET